MVKKLYILSILLFTSLLFGKTADESNYKLVYPKSIPANSNFDISLISSNPFAIADKLEIYFVPSSKINFKNLKLRFVDNDLDINCKQLNIQGISGNVYKANIDLKKNNLVSKIYFQILFGFKAENTGSADFKFTGIFKSGGKTIGYIQPTDKFEKDDSLKFLSATLNFYKPQKYADNAVSFLPGSALNINLNKTDVNNLLSEFWIKINNPQTDFLKIVNKQTGKTIYDISTNPFQMVAIRSEDHFDEESLNPYFLSRGVWYHVAILSSTLNNNISFYCNNTLIGRNKLPAFLKTNDLEWEFVNDSQNKNFQLDVLRFINFNSDIELSFLNKNYMNFSADSSSVLYQFNFKNEEELYLAKDEINISYNSVDFIKSDAPIFARAPELNINLLGNSYELTWSGGDFKQAQSYVLEKSLNNSDYKSVSTIQAENTPEKKYSILDVKDPSAEIVFYRIKQVNADGSTVYSSQVKIGQGATDPFVVEQNYPNPFNPRTSIVVELLEDSDVDITIYNLEGKEIAKLFKGFLTSGTHKFSFDAAELPSGIYLYKVSTPNYSNTKKMILTK